MPAAGTRRPAPAPKPVISLIVAMDENGVIGADGGMPWHIRGDLRWFRSQTLDKPILMGRRTFESIGKPLPRRRNLVLTRDGSFGAEGCDTVAGMDEAVALVRDDAAAELMVIGGAQVYALALEQATRLLVTRIEQRYHGDTWFPPIDWRAWDKTWEKRIAASDDQPAHRFMTWARRGG